MPGTCEGASGATSGLPVLRLSVMSAVLSVAVGCRRLRPVVELLEELPELVPDLPPAGEPPPAGPDQAHQRKALVDRDQPLIAGAPRPVHEQRLHVGLQLA